MCVFFFFFFLRPSPPKVFTSLKTMTADIVVQKVIEGKEEVDLKRVAVFASFGFGYWGVFQYFIYVKGFSRLFPQAGEFAAKSIRQKLRDRKGILALGGQLGLDQCVHIPFVFFPSYYLVKERASWGIRRLARPPGRGSSRPPSPSTRRTWLMTTSVQWRSGSPSTWSPLAC